MAYLARSRSSRRHWQNGFETLRLDNKIILNRQIMIRL